MTDCVLYIRRIFCVHIHATPLHTLHFPLQEGRCLDVLRMEYLPLISGTGVKLATI